MTQAIDRLFVRIRSIPFFWRLALFTERPWNGGTVPRPRLDPLERLGFWVFGASLFAVFGVTRSLVSPAWIRGFVICGTLAGLFALARFFTAGRKLRP